jgi:hypothetical protein
MRREFLLLCQISNALLHCLGIGDIVADGVIV